MSKRFNNPDERPQVNLPEMLEMTRNMIRALTLIDYDKDETHWQQLVRQAAQLFTADQMKALDSGAKLRGSDLAPAQRQMLQQAVLSNTFARALHLWESVLPNLENMPASRLQARKADSVTPGPNTPTHDYVYIYRAANGQLHVYELPHIVFGSRDVRIVTP